MKKKISNRKNQLNLIISFLCDFFYTFKFKLTIVSTLSIIVSIGFVFIFFITITYFKNFYSGVLELNLLGNYNLKINNSEYTVYLVSIIILILLIVTSFLEFFLKKKINALASLYDQYCVERILYILDMGFLEINYQESKRLVKNIPKILGICGRLAAYSFSNFIILPIIFLFLLYLNFKLTLIVFFCLIVVLIANYFLSIKGSKKRELMKKSLIDATSERTKLLDFTLTGFGSIYNLNNIIKFYFKSGANRIYADSFTDIKNNLDRGSLATKLSVGIFLCLIIIYINFDIKLQKNLDLLILYIFGLQFLSFKLIAVSRSIVGILKFYNDIRDYFSVIKNYEIFKNELDRRILNNGSSKSDKVNQLDSVLGIYSDLPVEKKVIVKILKNLKINFSKNINKFVYIVNPIHQNIKVSVLKYFHMESLGDKQKRLKFLKENLSDNMYLLVKKYLIDEITNDLSSIKVFEIVLISLISSKKNGIRILVISNKIIEQIPKDELKKLYLISIELNIKLFLVSDNFQSFKKYQIHMNKCFVNVHNKIQLIKIVDDKTTNFAKIFNSQKEKSQVTADIIEEEEFS
jgi:hypothetical protein